jgi:hypothetical protein
MADRAYNDGRMRTMYNDEKDERKENKKRGRERMRRKKKCKEVRYTENRKDASPSTSISRTRNITSNVLTENGFRG